MLTVTVDDVMSFGPCSEYTRERVAELFAGRDRLFASEILDVDIPVKDRLWLVLREELIPPKELRLFAARCAEMALDRVEARGGKVDPRSRFSPRALS